MEKQEKLDLIISLNKKLNNLKNEKEQFLVALNGLELDSIRTLPNPEYGRKGVFGIELSLCIRRYGDDKLDHNLKINNLHHIDEVELLSLYKKGLDLEIEKTNYEIEKLL